MKFDLKYDVTKKNWFMKYDAKVTQPKMKTPKPGLDPDPTKKTTATDVSNLSRHAKAKATRAWSQIRNTMPRRITKPPGLGVEIRNTTQPKMPRPPSLKYEATKNFKTSSRNYGTVSKIPLGLEMWPETRCNGDCTGHRVLKSDPKSGATMSTTAGGD